MLCAVQAMKRSEQQQCIDAFNKRVGRPAPAPVQFPRPPTQQPPAPAGSPPVQQCSSFHPAFACTIIHTQTAIDRQPTEVCFKHISILRKIAIHIHSQLTQMQLSLSALSSKSLLQLVSQHLPVCAFAVLQSNNTHMTLASPTMCMLNE